MGRPARGIVNRVMAELNCLHPAAPPFPLTAGEMAPLRAAAEALGSADLFQLWAGQNSFGCQVIPAAAMLRQLARKLPTIGREAGWIRSAPFEPWPDRPQGSDR